jgi:hypothetical protein
MGSPAVGSGLGRTTPTAKHWLFRSDTSETLKLLLECRTPGRHSHPADG